MGDVNHHAKQFALTTKSSLEFSADINLDNGLWKQLNPVFCFGRVPVVCANCRIHSRGFDRSFFRHQFVETVKSGPLAHFGDREVFPRIVNRAEFNVVGSVGQYHPRQRFVRSGGLGTGCGILVNKRGSTSMEVVLLSIPSLAILCPDFRLLNDRTLKLFNVA